MTKLVLNPLTQQQLGQLGENLPHAVQIVGPSGIGKRALAVELAATSIGISAEKLADYPYFLHLQPENNVIPIEMIRGTQHFLRLKTIGRSELRRVILVEDAHLMTIEAQNAFLKSVEEPPSDTIIILTVSQPKKLLPTMSSRLQTLSVHVPSKEALQAHFADASGFDQAYRLSGGLPGLLYALLEDDQTHPLHTAVAQAKDFLQAPVFVRLSTIDSLTAHRDAVTQFLTAVARIAQTGLEQAAAQHSTQLPRWQRILSAVHDAKQALTRNANLKLVLSQFALSC
jgi:hypothetical protein